MIICTIALALKEAIWKEWRRLNFFNTMPHVTICNSKPVPTCEHRKYGTFTNIPVRRNVTYKLGDLVADQLLEQWENTFGDGLTKTRHGNSNPIAGNWDGTIYPEAKPERLGYALWFTEFFFLIDDKADTMTAYEAHTTLNKEFDKLFAIEDENIRLQHNASAMEKMTIPFLNNILTFDKTRALPILREWRHWLRNVDSKTVDYFNTIEEYILYRAMNIGIRPCGPTMRFVMELDVTEEEVELVNPILWHVCATIALTNDYWSWHKEALHAGPEQQMKIMSGVAILMKEKKVEVPEALEMLKQLACEYEQKVVEMCADIISKYPRASKDFHAYVQGQLWLVAGNDYWSSTCRRYHTGTIYT